MLKHRVVSGLSLGVLFLGSAMFLPQIWVWAVIVVVATLGQLEFYILANRAGIPVYRVLGVVCGLGVISATYYTAGPEAGQIAASYKWDSIALLASFILIFARQFLQKDNRKSIEIIGATVLGILYVPFLLNYATRLAFCWTGTQNAFRMSETGRLLILYLLIVVKMTDVGAFFTGMLIGRHKLIPRVSPGKTWEGLVGGVLVAVAASCSFCYLVEGRFGVIRMDMADAVVLGIVLALAGVVGDLFESVVKRSADMKDSGSVIPGMGGILDVIDSLLFGAPVLYAYVTLFMA